VAPLGGLAAQVRLVRRKLRRDDEDARRRAAAKVVLAFGAFVKENGERNTVIVLGPDGEVLHRQVKSVPVQFMRDGLPAADRAPAETPLGKIGFAICCDMDFPFVTRELVREGAELLVSPTMDAESWGPAMKEQHASLAAIRAVEHQRWVIRCASSGVSLVAEPNGNVTTGKGVLCAKVEFWSPKGLYTRVGCYLSHFCAGFTLALLVLALRRRPTA
jgi:apolipoprotein N-acyltransferase